MEEARGLAELVKAGWKPKRPSFIGAGRRRAGPSRLDRICRSALRRNCAPMAWRTSTRIPAGELFRRAGLAHFRKVQQRHHAEVSTGNETERVETSAAQRDRRRENSREAQGIRERARPADWSPWLGIRYNRPPSSITMRRPPSISVRRRRRRRIYHSIYDDFYWYTHFSDTEFVYGRALAQTGGTAVMRMADADLLPFEFGDFADTVHMYVKD